ncbi:MAG: F0F1 ATP synthase subunit epsilon [Rhodospirillaceae bacterium]|jgi:F-type H+-transporting ATPase subunit epsilon|nr:F0F1 ATP synthase subunit epsilon [Rhodospirillaceae bacterium]MBT5667560.1 F0F1 ATP synthase subunit epsilon [Rhodospirillaceae bacterium]
MADTIELELVSPEKLLLSEQVEMVVIPGEDGDFGVLPGHSPVISNIRPGVLSVFENGAVTQRIFIASGFAEVTMERCTILAEGAEPVEDLDQAAVDQEIQELREDATNADDDVSRARVNGALAIAEAKRTAITAPAY